MCVWATGPFECDEWAVDIEQRGWAGHGPGGWTKAVTVQKKPNTMLSHSSLCLIMQDNTSLNRLILIITRFLNVSTEIPLVRRD